jgi:hypothetical protein
MHTTIHSDPCSGIAYSGAKSRPCAGTGMGKSTLDDEMREKHGPPSLTPRGVNPSLRLPARMLARGPG